MTHQEIIDAFRARVRELKQKHSDVKFTNNPGSEGDGNRFVAVIDSIVSMPGVLLPWKELVNICAEEGIWSVLDAAHSIGQEVRIGRMVPVYSTCNAFLSDVADFYILLAAKHQPQ